MGVLGSPDGDLRRRGSVGRSVATYPSRIMEEESVGQRTFPKSGTHIRMKRVKVGLWLLVGGIRSLFPGGIG